MLTSQMKKIFSRGMFTALSLAPLAVFLNVARHYGSTREAWSLAFLSGAGAAAAVMLFFRSMRVPSRDLLVALALLFVSGSLAFLTDFRPALELYRRFEGSVFLAWYLFVRALFYFAPGLLSGFAYDPYPRAPGLAAVLLAGAFGWSLFHSDVLVSTAAPTALILVLLSPLESVPAGRDNG